MFGIDLGNIITIVVVVLTFIHNAMTRYTLMNNHIRHLQEGQDFVRRVLQELADNQVKIRERLSKIEGKLNGK